jgi:protease-4
MSDNNIDSGESAKAEQGNETWQRGVLERLAFATLDEQRRRRRWGIFFKSLLGLYLLAILLLSQSGGWGEKNLASRYTALVDLDGVIEANGDADADTVISGLRAAFESKATVGVILRTNSPGGSPVQASYIYDEIQRLREKYPDTPLYAVVGDICASGCYYVVAAADQIYANPASIVGSIGVLMDGFGFVDGMKKLGIERRLMTAGENKGMLDPFSPLDPKARAHTQKMLNEIHQQFIDAVREGRGDSLKNDKDLFSGMFWTGAKAKELGLVDDFGSASYVAREVIGAEEIVDFSVQQNLIDRFAQRFGAAVAKGVGLKTLQHYVGLR